MDRLPVELIQAILMHTDVDEDLLKIGLVCRKFAATLQDTTFALEHIRRRFQLSRNGILNLNKLNEMVHLPGLDAVAMRSWGCYQDERFRWWEQVPDHLPFAYKVALFVLASQANELFHMHLPPVATLRIAQSIDAAHAVNWENVIIFLATTDHVSAIKYIIGNHQYYINNSAIQEAIEEATAVGQTETLLLLLACRTGELEPVSLDGALLGAVTLSERHCVEAILNDPYKRVTCKGMESALQQSVEDANLPISVLLVQHGVSLNCLASLHSNTPRFVQRLMAEADHVLLLESVRDSDCSTSRQLLNEERATIMMKDYALVRLALDLQRTEHLLLFLEVAEQKSDAKPFKIVREHLNQNETPAHFRKPLVKGIKLIKKK